METANTMNMTDEAAMEAEETKALTKDRESIQNRYEFVVLFDCENGNPNGDPDAGNMPRVDPETGRGIVTDVCLKRKIRNYVDLVCAEKVGYNILIKGGKSLNSKFVAAYDTLGLDIKKSSAKDTKKKNKKDEATDEDKAEKTVDVSKILQAQEFMCKNYFDVRAFGAVMSTGNASCGTVRGPVQFNFAQSVDPVAPQEYTVTRCCVTAEDDIGKGCTMGKKAFIHYGLYRAEGYISAMQARSAGFTEDDLELFWEAIENMFEHERSAARGKMTVRKLYIFKHSNVLGNASAGRLFDLIKIEKKDGVVVPRSFSDYAVTVADSVPQGIEFIERV